MDRNEKNKNYRAMIVLAAAFIAQLLNMKYKRDLTNSLIIVLIVIVVFFFISTIAIKLIDIISNMDRNIIEENDDENDEADGEE